MGIMQALRLSPPEAVAKAKDGETSPGNAVRQVLAGHAPDELVGRAVFAADDERIELLAGRPLRRITG